MGREYLPGSGAKHTAEAFVSEKSWQWNGDNENVIVQPAYNLVWTQLAMTFSFRFSICLFYFSSI